MKILIAVDGSKNAMKAVECLIEHADWYREAPAIELVTVHLPVPKLPNLGKVVGRKAIERYYEEEGQANLQAAARRLTSAGLAFTRRVLVGPIAETLAKHAEAGKFDLVLVATRGHSAAVNALIGSTATKLLQVARTPVLLVR